MTLRSKWTRQIHRISWTIVGVFLAFLLLLVPFKEYQIGILIGVLACLVEVFVVRNYGLAAIFITSLTVFMAEMSGVVGGGNATSLILTRVSDIALGSVIGFISGICIHSVKFKDFIRRVVLIF